MTQKHTPAPWDVQNKGVLGERSARHEVVQGINVNGKKNLPTIVKMPDLSDRSYANARLIAAAPELLAALEWAVEAAERHNNGGSLDYDWIEEAEEAISKATSPQAR